jgi:hypothetical protein
MAMEPKVCPECRDEYVHSASVCRECGVALVTESELTDDEAEELPPIEELVCIRASSVGWAMALSERLAVAGIPHRIEAARDPDDEGGRGRPGHNLPYGVFVLEQDVAAAAAIDAEHTESQIPDMPRDFDPTAESEDCPACGDPIDESASECPGCGLALIPLE